MISKEAITTYNKVKLRIKRRLQREDQSKHMSRIFFYKIVDVLGSYCILFFFKYLISSNFPNPLYSFMNWMNNLFKWKPTLFSTINSLKGL